MCLYSPQQVPTAAPGWPETHCVAHVGHRLPTVLLNVGVKGVSHYTWLPPLTVLRNGFSLKILFLVMECLTD